MAPDGALRSGAASGCPHGRERGAPAQIAISFKPHVRELLHLPGLAPHGAEPFRGTGERRSMSFNAAVI